MDAWQWHSEFALSELHERAGLLPPSVCLAFDQCRLYADYSICPAKHLNNRKLVGDFEVCSAECSVVLIW